LLVSRQSKSYTFLKMHCEVIFCVLLSMTASVTADGGGHSHGGHHAAHHAPAPAPAPEPVYVDSPQTGYSAEVAPAGFDMSMLILPFIALIGLFLLFPTYITLDTVRRKRSVGDGEDAEAGGVLANMVDRIQDIYGSVIESEECLERIACQIGGLARDAGMSSSISQVALLTAPTKYKKFARQFARPKNCHKIKCNNSF